MLCCRYTARQAPESGLTNSAVPKENLDEEVRKWRNKLLSQPPAHLKILKRSFFYHVAPILDRNMHERTAEG